MRIELLLQEAIRRQEELPWECSLFIRSSDSLSPDAEVIIISDDENENDLEKKGYRYLFGISDLQDVITNLRGQIDAADEDLCIEALKYYAENDAFINFVPNR